MTLLSASYILPAIPVLSEGSRTEKSPQSKLLRTCNISWLSIRSASIGVGFRSLVLMWATTSLHMSDGTRGEMLDTKSVERRDRKSNRASLVGESPRPQPQPSL